MNHAARITDDPPVALAKRAISLLEQRLEERYGLCVDYGAELEFSVSLRDAAQGMTARDFGVKLDKATKRPGVFPSSTLPTADKDPWFPDSRSVAYSYREHGTHDRYAKLEVVLSHEPRASTGDTLARGGVQFARTIEALRYQLKSPAPGYKDLTPGPGRSIKRAQRWQDFRREEVRDLRIGHFFPERDMDHTDPNSRWFEAMTNGLHLNTNLADAVSGENIHRAGHTDVERFMPAMRQVFNEGLYLLMPDLDAWNRFKSRSIRQLPGREESFYAEAFAPGCKGKKTEYIENSLPAAHTNPYYVVMLQLLAYERALRTQHYVPDGEGGTIGEPPALTIPPPRGMFEMVGRWHECPIKSELNDLEAGLGDQLFEAITKCKPGFERSAMDKRHADQGQSRQ